jgi:hypothetical protein
MRSASLTSAKPTLVSAKSLSEAVAFTPSHDAKGTLADTCCRRV